jgi:hypothetical protein
VSNRELIKQITLCKGVLRHAWFPTTTDKVPEFGAYIVNACERCGTHRYMIISRRGEPLTKWRYEYQDKLLYKQVTAESMEEWRSRYAKTMRIRFKEEPS